MPFIFRTLASVISLYSTLCVIRIILTWFPGAEYSPIGRFFSEICDPYLNLFRKLPLRIGILDMSAAIGIIILSAFSSILMSISSTGVFSISNLVLLILQPLWGIVTFCMNILIVCFLVRFIVLLVNPKSAYDNSPWAIFDSYITPLAFRLTKIFSPKRPLNMRTSMILACLLLVVIETVGSIGIVKICELLRALPI